jgi:AFG3 family protein
LIDQEVSLLVEEQYQRAKKILNENKEKHATLAELLLEKEVIFSEDLEKIFGKRKGPEHVISANGNGDGDKEESSDNPEKPVGKEEKEDNDKPSSGESSGQKDESDHKK